MFNPDPRQGETTRLSTKTDRNAEFFHDLRSEKQRNCGLNAVLLRAGFTIDPLGKPYTLCSASCNGEHKQGNPSLATAFHTGSVADARETLPVASHRLTASAAGGRASAG